MLQKYVTEEWLVVYIDNILIYSNDLQEYHKRTQLVLQTLHKDDLFLKPSKCYFDKNSIEYLGLVISHNYMDMDPMKLQGIQNWDTPQNVKQL